MLYRVIPIMLFDSTYRIYDANTTFERNNQHTLFTSNLELTTGLCLCVFQAVANIKYITTRIQALVNYFPADDLDIPFIYNTKNPNILKFYRLPTSDFDTGDTISQGLMLIKLPEFENITYTHANLCRKCNIFYKTSNCPQCDRACYSKINQPMLELKTNIYTYYIPQIYKDLTSSKYLFICYINTNIVHCLNLKIQ
jgi:hypothetical protein